jgi:hypothetical protein
MPSFWTGLARVFDLGATMSRHSYVHWDSPEEADWVAIRSDWEAVGDDLRVALGWAQSHFSRSADGEAETPEGE